MNNSPKNLKVGESVFELLSEVLTTDGHRYTIIRLALDSIKNTALRYDQLHIVTDNPTKF